jgi:hypothetical protein
MNPHELATRDTPRSLETEITRYGGVNPYGKPSWRVVLGQNVREQCFGTMRFMPRVSADADIADIEPERYESGEMWVPRYIQPGWILERWFPAHAWGSQTDWEMATTEDGQQKLKGEWPRQGDYFMVGDGPFEELPPAEFWKQQIARLLREEAQTERDPATNLSLHLYMERTAEEARRERFQTEVNFIHKSVTDPMLATIGTTAQRIRDQIAQESGFDGHFSAG